VVREVAFASPYFLPVASGCRFSSRGAGAPLLADPRPEVISLYLSIRLAWVFAVEIPRRMEPAENRPALTGCFNGKMHTI